MGRGQLAAGPNGSLFNQTFNYAEAGLLYRVLPYDRLTPYILAGGGISQPRHQSLPVAAACCRTWYSGPGPNCW